jgi:hypothetical protein
MCNQLFNQRRIYRAGMSLHIRGVDVRCQMSDIFQCFENCMTSHRRHSLEYRKSWSFMPSKICTNSSNFHPRQDFGPALKLNWLAPSFRNPNDLLNAHIVFQDTLYQFFPQEFYGPNTEFHLKSSIAPSYQHYIPSTIFRYYSFNR